MRTNIVKITDKAISNKFDIKYALIYEFLIKVLKRDK